MATFNILSSCICRDAFGFNENNEHEINTFLQSTSALTWFLYKSQPRKLLNMSDLEEIGGLSNFQRKCITNDYNRTVFDHYNKKTDFFVIDMTEFASMKIGRETFSDGTEHYFTFSKWFATAFKNGLNEKLSPTVDQLEQLEIINSSVIDETLTKYVKWIAKKGYSQKQVIIVENKRASYYTDGELLYKFSGETLREKINTCLDKIYACLEEKMPNAHVIKMPTNVLGDTRHRWGLTDLHFCKEYYNYLYECFDLIATKCSCYKELIQKRDLYSDLFCRKKDSYLLNSFNYADGVQLLKGKLTECDEWIAPKGTPFYKNDIGNIINGKLTKSFMAKKHNYMYAQLLYEDLCCYVENDSCLKGVTGEEKRIGRYWMTANKSTQVIVKDNSIVISHNGIKSPAQMQMIQTIENNSEFRGKTVTFSVWARVLRLNDNNKGGSIAIINAQDYNGGKFYVKADFENTEWKRISVTARMPENEEFKGLTVCMRALAAGKNAKHAVVEFSDPKLELGSFATKY